ncbi:protease-associated domain-containing protein 1-like [Amphiura filiformis]|uniref:protease-associated domain-containing protein 1-like n=1 Tax=Amphiura filiformis TaxID=82378 RepID=UPI003B20EC03
MDRGKMAAHTSYSRSLLLLPLPMLKLCFQCKQRLILVVGMFIFIAQCIAGHAVNENLFMEVLSPDDVSYTYKIRPARTFGGVFDYMMDSVQLVPADPEDACGELYNAPIILNSVALIKRGHCSFLSKVIVAERAGAVAVVIYDHDEKNDWSFIDMIGDGSEREASIPAVFLLGRDGNNIQRSLHYHHLLGAVINIPVNITGKALGLVNVPPWSLF